jgi:hypothetical protein
MGIIAKILGVSTAHEGQHQAGKHTKSGSKIKKPKKPKGK